MNYSTRTVEWGGYAPSADMQAAIDHINQLSMGELAARLPAVGSYSSGQVAFDYRIYSKYDLAEVEKVYVILGGFAERANSLDAGLKGLLIDLLTSRLETRKYAILSIGGLFTFPLKHRNRFIKQGSGALLAAAEEVASLLAVTFPSVRIATTSGYSMGGTMAPLVAQAIMKRRIAVVDQVCCGEPAFYAVSTTRLHLLKRATRSSAYRNEQIRASSIPTYITIKKTPSSLAANVFYRLTIYRPLFVRALSMRLIARDLALQASNYDRATGAVQIKAALRYLAKQQVRINLLHAEHSIICDPRAFYQLVDSLSNITGSKLYLTIVKGSRADHGIEEQRSLSTPFLVRPELYAGKAPVS